LPKCPASSFHKNAAAHIPEALLPALGPILETIGWLTQRIREYDRKLETICRERYPETELLRQVEGVGPLTALTFVLTVGDPYRFEKSRSVGAYLGLVPATARSGDRDSHKRISKEGDEMMRRLLVSRLALLNPSLYSISALFPVSAWLGSVAKLDEPAMNSNHMPRFMHRSAWKGNSANFACYEFCAVSSLRGSPTGHLIGPLSCGKMLPASHLAGPSLESVGGL
jgi:Transposase IS116/IS110/IS902 family